MPQGTKVTPKPAPAASGRQEPANKTDGLHSFAERFLWTFEGANDSEIARRCETTHTTIREYTSGRRYPTPELLLRINRATGVNIHWLLKGEGPRRVSGADRFSPAEEDRIRQIAARKDLSFEEAVRELTLAAVDINDRFSQS